MTRPGRLRPAFRPALGVALGLAAVALAARPVAAGDRVHVVLLAAVPAALIAVVGTLVLDGLRRRRIATQVVVVALTTLAVVAVGARAAASAMFLSAHDLAVLDLVLVVAAVVALAAALVLATRLSSGVVTLRRLTDRIGDRAPLAAGPERGAADAARRALPAELGAVADALDELDERLRAGEERQRALESSRRELVAWVSHDIRTPLAGIRALAEALEDGVVTDDETVARYHRTLRIETERLTRLVDDLFELSRTSAGVLRLRFERVSLEDLVSDAIAASTTTAHAEGVHLVGAVEGSPDPVDVSVAELLRAVRNIVDNGIRHTPPGGTVRVEAGVRDGVVQLAVCDTGGGIPPDERERIFVAGFSGDAARTPDGHGAGLGLAIARGLVEAHAGTIAVADSPGGARFVLTVPARRSVQHLAHATAVPMTAERIAVD